MFKNKNGFTIVELLIVIVVIGILAAVSIVSYNGIVTRAKIASASDGLAQVHKSMLLWSIDQGFSNWPIDPISGGGTALSAMIQATPSLKSYIQSTPSVVGLQSEEWFYDNDGNTKTNCTNPYGGVNIVLRYVTDTAVAQGIDDRLDDGNLLCGKVRYVDQRIFYALSFTQTVE